MTAAIRNMFLYVCFLLGGYIFEFHMLMCFNMCMLQLIHLKACVGSAAISLGLCQLLYYICFLFICFLGAPCLFSRSTANTTTTVGMRAIEEFRFKRFNRFNRRTCHCGDDRRDLNALLGAYFWCAVSRTSLLLSGPC